MGTYVYGFAHASHPLPLSGLVGVGADGPPLRRVARGDLVAIVSDAPPGLRAKRRDLMRHERVLETLVAGGTVLPMRFGMVAPNDESVRRELAVGEQRYRSLLRRLAGAVELNVKGTYRQDAVLIEILTGSDELRRRTETLRASGGGTRAERIEFGERVAAAVADQGRRDAEVTLERLRPFASQVSTGPAVDGCYVNTSFLVATGGVAAFTAAADALGRDVASRADLRVYGPLPPYSFVTTPEPPDIVPAKDRAEAA